jgi:predicted transcriptional regulator
MYDRDGNCLYTIGYLAQVTGRAECTIRNYITAGVIPDAAYYDKRGWRIYTERKVKLVEEVFNSLLIGEITSLYQVSDELKKRWDDDKK